MIDPIGLEARKQRSEDRKSRAFDEWLREPMVELSLTMVPAANPPEVLQQLLRSAFDFGFNAGSGDMALGLLEAIIKNEDQRNER